ncbi:MAG: hypothetical protein IPP01_09560 [Saprospiraceae bacterium]|nr:hypothetical protein [Saprospiraceae bacterium]
MKKILFYSLLLLSILTSCKTSNLFVEENTRNTVQDLDSVFYQTINMNIRYA